MSYSKKGSKRRALIEDFNINTEDLSYILYNFIKHFDKTDKLFEYLYSYDSEEYIYVFNSNPDLYYRYVQVSRRYYNDKTNDNILSKFYNLKTDNDISFTQGRIFEIETDPVIEFEIPEEILPFIPCQFIKHHNSWRCTGINTENSSIKSVLFFIDTNYNKKKKKKYKQYLKKEFDFIDKCINTLYVNHIYPNYYICLKAENETDGMFEPIIITKFRVKQMIGAGTQKKSYKRKTNKRKTNKRKSNKK